MRWGYEQATGETARDEPRALPRREHRVSPKRRYHDWLNIIFAQTDFFLVRGYRVYMIGLWPGWRAYMEGYIGDERVYMFCFSQWILRFLEKVREKLAEYTGWLWERVEVYMGMLHGK
jgi:hypothetical protein